MSINSPESLPEDEPQEEEAAAGAVNKEDDGGVPTGQDGVGLGFTSEANTFEPEEDTEAE
jgi:hypothetical protein